MGADVSRVRFDPLQDFAGVVLQQGRLLLDGDFNEYVALLDRRLRAETCDLTSFGPDPDHAGVSWVPRQTPDGFRVDATGGALTIGRGRMYVDGLLAENHGVAPHDDPCELPPSGGFRGLENQPYRVEIHAGGAPGTATFKWSRDNGSVAIPVVEMVSSTILRLTSVGKDDVLRISTGDWVEI